ncbi:hypothetical protein ACFL2T_04005 [Elusimicrobiota bacterium]
MVARHGATRKSKEAGLLGARFAFHQVEPPIEAELRRLSEEIRRKVLNGDCVTLPWRALAARGIILQDETGS